MNRAGMTFHVTAYDNYCQTVSFADAIKNGCILGFSCGLSD